VLRGKYLDERDDSRSVEGRAALALVLILRTAWVSFVTGGVTLDICALLLMLCCVGCVEELKGDQGVR